MLTHERLLELLRYRDDGVLVWRESRRGHIKKGEIAGGIVTRGPAYCRKSYWSVGLDLETYPRSKLVWFYHYGDWPEDLNYADRNPLNDRIENLRLATKAQFGASRLSHRNNTLEYKGVSWHARSQKWVASVRFRGRMRCLGYFDTAKAAGAAYRDEVLRLRGGDNI
jgi:hypothetical protein